SKELKDFIDGIEKEEVQNSNEEAQEENRTQEQNVSGGQDDKASNTVTTKTDPANTALNEWIKGIAKFELKRAKLNETIKQIQANENAEKTGLETAISNAFNKVKENSKDDKG